MKKLFLLVMLVSVMVSSCKNDAIDVNVKNTPEPKVSLTVNISTTSGFEPFNIENYKSQYLTESYPYFIGVTTFLYDASGTLVGSGNSHTKTFNQVTQSFSGLNKGNYTVVTVETLVNSDYSYTSDFWNIEGSNNITTLSLTLNTDKASKTRIDGGAVVAISSKTINVSSDMTESLTPSPVGTIVHTYYLDFDKSNYVLVAFYSKNQPIGMYLNPSIPSSEKYIYEKNLDTNIFAIRDYVSDAVFTKQEYERSVYLLEEGNVQWCFGSSTQEFLDAGKMREYPRGQSYLTSESGKNYYAAFCYVGGPEDNNCEVFIGNSEAEAAAWYKSLDKSKQISKELYKEPYMTWGGSVADVKTYMSSYSLEKDIQLGSSGSYYMQYRGQDYRNNDMIYQYEFKQSTTGLETINVLLDGTRIKEDDIKTHLLYSGYVYSHDLDSNSLHVYTSSKSIAGYYKTSTGNYVVIYVERSAGSRMGVYQ
jgi:hypothetical protein